MRKHDLVNRRIWEIDALRGYVILWVLIYHAYTAVYTMLINVDYTGINPLQLVQSFDPNSFFFKVSGNHVEKAAFYQFMDVFHAPFVDLLFVISGISFHFSKNHLKNGFRLLAGAAFVSLFTWMLTIITGDKHQFIRFGVLHCYALCHLIYYFLLENRKTSILIFVAILSLAIGYYLKNNPISSDWALLVPFGIYENGAIQRDYWPVFPMLGWLLIGVILGKRFYSKKETLFPGQAARKWHRPLCFLGRYSGWIYCGHMVVYTIVFCGIGYFFDLY